MDDPDLGITVMARTVATGAVLLIAPSFSALPVAVMVYFLVPRIQRLFETETVREQRLGVTQEVPLLAELLAAHLAAGAGILEALNSLTISLTSALGPATERVMQRLRAGDPDPFEPWRETPGLITLANACTRSLRSGTSMSAAAIRLSERMRMRERLHRQANLERAVVRMTLPLGICLLPAFIASVVIPMAYVLFSQVRF